MPKHLPYPWMGYYQRSELLSSPEEKAKKLCIEEILVSFEMGKVKLEHLLDNLLAHVTEDGLAHEGDGRDAGLGDLASRNALCAVFRMWTLGLLGPGKQAVKIKAGAVSSAKGMLLEAWNGNASQNPLPTSPLLQALVAIAFLRRDAELLDRLLSTPVPAQTIFDVMHFEQLEKGCKSIGLWLVVLRTGWIHQPNNSDNYHVPGNSWTTMLCDALPSADVAKDPLKQLKPFLRELAAHRIAVNPGELARQIEIGHNPFPNLLSLVSSLPDLVMREGDSANVLLRAVVRSDALQKDKCELLTVLLDQGLDADWTAPPIPNPDPREYENPRDQETALSSAVSRNQMEVAKLLVSRGANTPATRRNFVESLVK